MKQLEPADFDRSRAFLLEHARPLDRERFRFHFEGGSSQPVVSELAHYQNADGGFGNALEPDFRLPASSAMATSHAFHVLIEVGADSKLPIVQRALAYTLAGYRSGRRGWLDVPLEVNDSPHAPWWQRVPDAAPTPESWGNPDADLIASCFAYASEVPRDRLEELEAAARLALDSLPSPLSPYVALCLSRLAKHAPPSLRRPVLARLEADARTILDLAPEARAQDHFPLHWLAETPDAPLAEFLAPELETHLDSEIERQSDAGCWDPRWSWGPGFPDVWVQAEREWRGFVTLDTLLVLRAHGRLQEPIA